jgi:hypothetical protein
VAGKIIKLLCFTCNKVKDYYLIIVMMGNLKEFCYGVYNQYESFICLDLMVKNMEVSIERYFKWWTGTKLV